MTPILDKTVLACQPAPPATPPVAELMRYHRLQPGGSIVVDDYGLEALSGVERACADFLAGKPESVVAVDGMTLGVIAKASP
jgi:hypothetical protein